MQIPHKDTFSQRIIYRRIKDDRVWRYSDSGAVFTF